MPPVRVWWGPDQAARSHPGHELHGRQQQQQQQQQDQQQTHGSWSNSRALHKWLRPLQARIKGYSAYPTLAVEQEYKSISTRACTHKSTPTSCLPAHPTTCIILPCIGLLCLAFAAPNSPIPPGGGGRRGGEGRKLHADVSTTTRVALPTREIVHTQEPHQQHTSHIIPTFRSPSTTCSTTTLGPAVLCAPARPAASPALYTHGSTATPSATCSAWPPATSGVKGRTTCQGLLEAGDQRVARGAPDL
jgi:hypothetical protein